MDYLQSALLDALADPVFLLDPALRILHASRAALEAEGMTLEEARALRYADLSGPAGLDETARLLQRVLDTGGSESAEVPAGDGRIYRVLATAATLPDSGTQHAVAVLHRDVTAPLTQARQLEEQRRELERRVLERTRELQKTNEKLADEFAHHRITAEALARSESRYRAVVEGAQEAILRISGGGVIEFLNAVAAEYVGAAPGSIVGKTLWDIFPHDAARKHIDAVRTVIESRRSSVTKVETTLQGRTVWFRTSLTPLEDPETGEVSALLVVRDVSSEERMARALRESEETYRTLVELSAEGIYVVRGGAVQYCNHRLLELTGLPGGEVAGHPVTNLYDPEERSDVSAWHESALADPEGATVVTTALRHTGGRRVPVEIAGRGIRYRGRGALLVSVHDLSPRHELQQRLVMADRLAAVGTLSAGIAHEFNNVNVSIRGFAELALSHPHLPPEVRDSLRRIRSGSQRAQRITDSLGTFSGGGNPTRRQANLRGIVETTLELLEHVFRKESCELQLALGPVPPLNIDEGEVGQVILNLLLNAVHAVMERPVRRIRIETGTDGADAFVRIEDTGHGIPRELRTRIFDAFYSTKGEYARTGPQARVRGSGLGLSISYRIVTDHGGRIVVESEPGAGAAFTVRLPITTRRCGDGEPDDETASTEDPNHGEEEDHAAQPGRDSREPGR